MWTGVYVHTVSHSARCHLPGVVAHAHVHAGHVHVESAHAGHYVRVFHYGVADKGTGGAAARAIARCWVVQPVLVYPLVKTDAPDSNVVACDGTASDPENIGPRFSVE